MQVLLCDSIFGLVLSDVEVSVAEGMYEFMEDANIVEVCAQLSVAPDNGLECSIVATLLPMDGPKAGKVFGTIASV